MRITIPIITILLLTNACYAQTKEPPKKAKIRKTHPVDDILAISAGGGGILPFDHVYAGKPVDALASRDKGGYVKILGLTIFIYKGFGIEGDFMINWTATKSSLFAGKVNEFDGANYFTSTAVDETFVGHAAKAMVGPVYKISKGKFLYVSKLLFGISYNQPADGYVMLIQKDSKDIIDRSYIADYATNGFLISPSFSVMYHVIKRLAVNVDISYYHSQYDCNYTETSYNNTTKTETSIYYPMHGVVSSISVGAGVTFFFR